MRWENNGNTSPATAFGGRKVAGKDRRAGKIGQKEKERAAGKGLKKYPKVYSSRGGGPSYLNKKVRRKNKLRLESERKKILPAKTREENDS